MKESRKVELSDGTTVEVGPLKWSGYKRLRSVFFKTLQGPVRQIINQLFLILPGSTEIKEVAKLATTDPRVAELVSVGLDAINDCLTEIEPALIASCSVGAFADGFFDSLPAADFLKLRKAAIDLSNFSELLELEKNFFTVAVTTGKKAMTAGSTGSPK